MVKTTPSTLRAHLVQKLREDILSGKYKPGQRLNESSIAREFEISRIPVREALFELRESGLLMSHERRGMFVTSLTPEDVKKINGVRIVLEAEALMLARARMTPALAATLTKIVTKMELSSATLLEAAALDLEFHRTIWAATGNDYLEKLLDPLATLIFAHNTLERVSSEHRQWRLNHHRALLDVILDPKAQDIKAALLAHMEAAYTDAKQPLRSPASNRVSVSKEVKVLRKSVKKHKEQPIRSSLSKKRIAGADEQSQLHA